MARGDKITNTLAAAAVAHRRGDTTTAKRLYRKVLKARPGHFKALRLAGALAQETGELDEAIKLLGAAVRHAPPDETGALEDLGLLHLQVGQQEKAESFLRRAVAINPGSIVALSRLGSTLLTCGRGSEAVTVLTEARAIDPKDPHLAYALAHSWLESREFQRAIETADEALELHPEHPATLVLKGAALYELNRHEAAEEVLAHAASLDSGEMNAWIHLGRARLARGDHDGAIEAFGSAASLSPDLATVHSQLANAYNITGRFDDAIAVCDAFLGRHPTEAAMILVKTIALRDSGRKVEADALLGQDALAIAREIPCPARYESVQSFNRGLERMIRNHPSLAHVHTNRATRHGIQTGSLMVDPPPEMVSLARAIDAQIRVAKQQLRQVGLGEHPWVRFAPSQWVMNAWAVVLSSGGYQLSHIHPEAWMSGVYYVALPASGMGSADGEGGWIELGRPTDQLAVRIEPPVRRIEPKPGLLVTFPSYTFHRTIPFEGEGERICIAFDVFAVPD